MSDAERPSDHAERMKRARLSLEGLSLGDAFGECFLRHPRQADAWVRSRRLPPAPWIYTDDTVMACAVVEVLDRYGYIDQDALAEKFAQRYMQDPTRGYGANAHAVLSAIGQGMAWSAVSRASFGGEGSMGNGAAMRVAPLGAYFAGEFEATARQARRSAEVTHAHPEGMAGAIAVAVAAAFLAAAPTGPRKARGRRLLRTALDMTPEGATRAGLERALRLSLNAPLAQAVARLGNGGRVTAPDTVPFALWCAARHLDSFEDALWSGAAAGGDTDTNGAIVGGLIALSAGPQGLPESWLAAREPLWLYNHDNNDDARHCP